MYYSLVKENNKIFITQHSDLYSHGFVLELDKMSDNDKSKLVEMLKSN